MIMARTIFTIGKIEFRQNSGQKKVQNSEFQWNSAGLSQPSLGGATNELKSIDALVSCNLRVS